MFPGIVLLGREIGMYAVMALCGIFSAGIYACVTANKRGQDYVDLIIFVLFGALGGVIGSHLLYALVNHNDLIYLFSNLGRIESFEMLFASFAFVFGGSVFYGSLIGALIAGYIVIRKNNNYRQYIDIVAVNIPLFHAWGRIGCFLGGCCFGIESHFGFTYHYSLIEEANGVSRFPVQLLEALFNLALFFTLNCFLKNEKFKNKLLYVYLIAYSTGRFFIEFLRGDSYRGFLFIFSTSQIISILILCVALPLMLGLIPRKQFGK